MEGSCSSAIYYVFLPQFPWLLRFCVRSSNLQENFKETRWWLGPVWQVWPGEVAERVTSGPHLRFFLLIMLFSIREWLGRGSQHLCPSFSQTPASMEVPLLQGEVPNSLAWPLRPSPPATSFFMPRPGPQQMSQGFPISWSVFQASKTGSCFSFCSNFFSFKTQLQYHFLYEGS